MGYLCALLVHVTERTKLGYTHRYPVTSFFRDPLIFTLDVPYKEQKKVLLKQTVTGTSWGTGYGVHFENCV